MSIVANTFQSYQSVGTRESLENTIYDISPSDVPFMSMIGRSKVKGTFAEWQTNSLSAPSATNAQVEGDEFAYTAVTPTVRLGNYTQILRKSVIVSGSQQAGNHAGRDSELSYNFARMSKEIKRDLETSLTGKKEKTVGSATAARYMQGVESWIVTNKSHNGTGATAAYSAGSAVTDGAQRAFTETLLKGQIQAAYTAGGDPDTIMLGPHNKQIFSGFAGRSTARQAIGAESIQAGASLYASDFGDFKVVVNRFSRDRTALILDKEYWSVGYFRDFRAEDVAKTGDALKKILLCEATLISKNEAASAKVAELSTS
jgi:hypothetical protein